MVIFMSSKFLEAVHKKGSEEVAIDQETRQYTVHDTFVIFFEQPTVESNSKARQGLSIPNIPAN